MKQNKKSLNVIALILFFQFSTFGQTFLNGSFEITTGNCNTNLSNVNFNNMMTNCFAFGSNSNIDIVKDTCGYGPAQQGNYFIGLAVNYGNTHNDALSLKLSEHLIIGTSYVLNFYNKKDSNFNSNLLEVGYSNDSLSFGNVIDTVLLPTTSWGLVSLPFTPIVNCQFITIRTIIGSYGWNIVDNFTIEKITGIFNTITKEQTFKIIPNPNSGKFTINNEKKVKKIEIYNNLGGIVYVTDLEQKTSNEIDLSDSSKGIYFIKIYDGVKIHTGKIVIQ